MHGEAAFVEGLGVRSVLDAGCGTGRVAIELARRGLEVVGLDADPGMLSAARAKAPDLDWVQADLSDFDLFEADGPGRLRRFDAAVMAGNVMIFVVPGTEGPVSSSSPAGWRWTATTSWPPPPASPSPTASPPGTATPGTPAATTPSRSTAWSADRTSAGRRS